MTNAPNSSNHRAGSDSPVLEAIVPNEATFLGPASVVMEGDSGIYSNLIEYEASGEQKVEVIVALMNDSQANADSVTVFEAVPETPIANVKTYHIHSDHFGAELHFWFLKFDGPASSDIAEATIVVEDGVSVDDIQTADNSGKRKAKSVTIRSMGGGH